MKTMFAHPDADAEFQAEVDFNEGREEGLGARFRAAVERAVERIRTQPNFFQAYEDTRCQECQVNGFPFAVYYLDRPD